MTYPAQPARNGMPPWAKWTMVGCGGCLTIVILGMVGCSVLLYQYFGWKMIDMNDKPDLPPTATASQLLPPKVDSFVRKSVTRFVSRNGIASNGKGWQGIYMSGSTRAELTVMPTAAAQSARSQHTPFGNAMRRQNQKPGIGMHLSIKKGPRPMDMVVWSKPNWTFMVQSQEMVAEGFARAYQPTTGARSRVIR